MKNFKVVLAVMLAAIWFVLDQKKKYQADEV